jgi:dihydrofolate reductase
MSLRVIVAMAENGVIGAGGKMPWHIPEDLAYFKRLTTGHVVVMGRKTFESLGRPLPGRTNVVVTRNRDWTADGALVVHSLGEAVRKYPDAFVIGGAEIYREALPLADELYITKIRAAYRGDTKFPKTDLRRWRRVFSEDHGSFEFTVYSRRSPK